MKWIFKEPATACETAECRIFTIRLSIHGDIFGRTLHPKTYHMFAPAAGVFCAFLLIFQKNMFVPLELRDGKKMSNEARLISRCRSYQLKSTIALHASKLKARRGV